MMMKQTKRLFGAPVSGVLGLLLMLPACRKHQMEDDMGGMEKNIAYPAAYVVNGESNSLSVIRLSDNTVSETIELMPAGGMAGMQPWPHHIYHRVNAAGHRLAVAMPGMDLSAGHLGSTAGMKGRIMILDAVTGAVVKEVEVPAMNHNAVYAPDGGEIWTSQMGTDGKVLVLDAESYGVKNTITVGREPAEVTFSADGSKAYVANGGDDYVTVINPTTKAVIATIPVGDNPVAAWVGYDGKMYVDNEDGQTVSVIDVAANVVVQTIPLGFMPGSVAHHSAKKELWVTDPDNGKVHYWTWNTTQNAWMHGGVFDAGAGAHATAFSNDGKTAYVTNQLAHSVSVINTATHSKIKDIPVGKKPNGIVLKY
jgi:YVTN family beta-propeller protein